jgi:DNA-directed RNA polymerase subunit K/omega
MGAGTPGVLFNPECAGVNSGDDQNETSSFVVYLPSDSCAFEFVVLTALRTKQLMAGCVPRVAPACKHTSTAAIEVVTGKVAREALPASLAGAGH